MTQAIRPLIAYVRVSTDRQGRSGLGLDAQRAALVTFAEANGFEILATYEEVETGKGSDALDRRPKLAAAMAAARRLKCAVAVAKLDRLSRDVVFISTMMTQRVPFIVAELGEGVDPFMLHVYAALAEKERAMIADRTRKALQALKAQGAKLGNRRNLTEASRAGAAANARDADTFARNVLPVIGSVRAAGVTSLRGIAAELNARRVKTARGGTWTAAQVKRVMDRAA